MPPEILREHLGRQPFIPFRIVETGGASYEVHNPNMARVTRHAIELGFPLETGEQRFVTIALIHVMHVEILLRTSAD